MDQQQEFTPQQYKKFNGQSIMLELEAMGGSATADDLAKHIGNVIDQPQQLVRQEVSQVLRRGISNGFFQRRGKQYFLFNEGSAYEVDSKKRKRKINNLPYELQTDGSSKIIRFFRNNDDEDIDHLKEQTIDGLQQIIAKANEETRKATVLATKAAKRAKSASTRIQEIVDSEDNERDD